MAKKIIDSYEYKEAPLRQALEYSSFGWQIARRSEHYSSKYRTEVVKMRRDIAIGANPTIHDLEKSYLRLERGKLPVKYINKPVLKAIGKIFVLLITIIFFFAGIALTAFGVYDGISAEKKERAIYNTAVEVGLTTERFYVDPVAENGSGIAPAYIDFASEHPTLDSFAELVEFADGKVSDEKLLNVYETWLFKSGLADYDDPDSFSKVDPTIIRKENGEYAAEEGDLNDILDIVRENLTFVNFDRLLDGMPVWINTLGIIGAGVLVVFILLAIIESAARKKGKKKKKQQCVVLMRDCVKRATDVLYDLKVENRELMTKKDLKLYDIENMFSQVMEPSEDDYD